MKKLDKYEYNLKLEEIDKLVDQGDYEEAAKLADSIEWKRVRNVRTLCLISEIYEAAGRLPDAKKILERAYRKTPVGKNVLYRLVEVTTALQQYDEALEYYTEYVQAAPHDNNRYILKYKLYRGRGSSVEELISILEEYLGQEYTERWAYELAKLYRQAGQMQKCLAACDDLVLWFHSGRYVRKALELKKKYAALTPKQQQIYEECLQEAAEFRAESDEESETETGHQDDSVVVNMESTDGEVIAEKIMAETEREIAEEVSARKAELEQQPDLGQDAPASSAPEQQGISNTRVVPLQGRKAETGKRRAAAQDQLAQEMNAQEVAAQEVAAPGAADGRQQGSVEAQSRRQQGAADTRLQNASNTQDSAKSDSADVQDAAADLTMQDVADARREVAQNINKKSAEAQEDLQVNMARSMREIVSGVVKRPEMHEEDLPASVESRPRMTQKVEVPDHSVYTAGRLSIDDILLSMGEKGKEYAAKAAQAEERAAAADSSREQTAPEQQPEETASEHSPERSASVGDEEQHGQALTMQEAVVEELTEAQREALQYTSNPEKLLRNKRSLPTYSEEPESLGATRRAPSREELMEAARQKLLHEKTIRMPQEEAAKRLHGGQKKNGLQPEDALYREDGNGERADGSFAKNGYAGNMDGSYAGNANGNYDENGYAGNANGSYDENGCAENANGSYDENGYAEKADGNYGENGYAENVNGSYGESGYAENVNGSYGENGYAENADGSYVGNADGGYGDPEAQSAYAGADGDNYQEAQGAYAGADEDNYQEIQDGYAEEDYPEDAYEAASEEDGYYEEDLLLIPDHLRNLFYGFIEIPELEDQIANAIIQAEAKGDDRTSKSGNILIFGAHGSGKTTMAMNLAKAIAQDRGSQVAKMAKIFAADLNKKDIASTIAKIAGGTLIIEEAGDLSDDTVDQLTTAMEFRTDGLIVILEDEQKYVHELLMRHPRFTMKFTAQIYIPEYTVEELAMFGQIYAQEQDYVIGDEGLDALCARISEAAEAKAEDGEPVTIRDAIDFVAKAIERSNGFFRKMKMGKKRYDENDFIILFAKDFK